MFIFLRGSRAEGRREGGIRSERRRGAVGMTGGAGMFILFILLILKMNAFWGISC